MYVPHIPGYNRVFTHVSHAAAAAAAAAIICKEMFGQHSWPVADFISIIPRRLMTAMLQDMSSSIWSCHRIADAVALCSPQVLLLQHLP